MVLKWGLVRMDFTPVGASGDSLWASPLYVLDFSLLLQSLTLKGW